MHNARKLSIHLSPGLLAIIISIASFAANYVFNLLLSRNLDPASYGDFYIVLRVIIIVGILGAYGTTTSSVKFIPKYSDDEDRKRIRGYLSWNRTVVLRISVIITIIGALIATACLIMMKLGIHTSSDVHPVVFAFWLIPLYTISLVLNSTLQGFKRVNLAIFLQKFMLLAIDLIFLLILIVSFKSISVYQVIFIVGIARMILVTTQLILLRKNHPETRKIKAREYENKKWNKYSQTMLASNFILFAGNAVIAIVFEILGKNEAEVGAYAAIITISALIYIISSAINTLFGPQISANTKHPDKLQALATKALFLRISITAPITILMLIFGAEILTTFNPLFAHYTQDLDIIIIASFIGTQVSLSANLLLYTGLEKLALYSNIFYLVVATILSIALIPTMQLTGAILASAVAIVGSYGFDFIANKFTSKTKILFFI